MTQSNKFLLDALLAAGEDKKHPFLSRLFQEAEDDFGVCSGAVKELMDEKNWSVKRRPKIIVVARENQSGNLTVRWYPLKSVNQPTRYKSQISIEKLSELEFEESYLGQCEGTEMTGGMPYRPLNEIMWFRQFRDLCRSRNEVKSEITASLLHAVEARYLELLDSIGKKLVIKQASEFVPIYKNGWVSDLELH
ncbi:hypothetical protein L2D14_06515 [Thalassospiraceae bacterium LMO-JJ14]|nr:hypothetical protein L2D14_06515 [Thalassospiraceae bacterium LMO-JJ14]